MPTTVPTDVPTTVPTEQATTGVVTVVDICGFVPESRMVNSHLYNQTTCDNLLNAMTIWGGTADSICDEDQSDTMKYLIGLHTMLGCCGYFTSANNTVTIHDENSTSPSSSTSQSSFVVGSNKCFSTPANPCGSHEFLGNSIPRNWEEFSDGTDPYPQTCHTNLYNFYLPDSYDYEDIVYTHASYLDAVNAGTTDTSFCNIGTTYGNHRVVESYMFGMGCCHESVQKPTCGKLEICSKNDFASISTEFSHEYVEDTEYSTGPTYSQILHGTSSEIEQYYTSITNSHDDTVLLTDYFSQLFQTAITQALNSNHKTSNMNFEFTYEIARHVIDDDDNDDDISYLEIIYTLLNVNVADVVDITSVIQEDASGVSLINRIKNLATNPNELTSISMNVIAPKASSLDEETVTCGEAYLMFDYISALYNEPSCDEEYVPGMKWGELLASAAHKCCISKSSPCPSYDQSYEVPYDPKTCNKRYNYHNFLKNTCGDCRLEPFSIRLHRRHRLDFEDCVGPRGDFTIGPRGDVTSDNKNEEFWNKN